MNLHRQCFSREEFCGGRENKLFFHLISSIKDSLEWFTVLYYVGCECEYYVYPRIVE